MSVTSHSFQIIKEDIHNIVMNDFGLLIFVDMSTSKLSFYDITKNSIFNK